MSNQSIVIPFRRPEAPGILATTPLARRMRIEPDERRPSRYVMETHTLSAPMANPKALLIAACVAVGLYVLARRIAR
jgi:hypothetical protein